MMPRHMMYETSHVQESPWLSSSFTHTHTKLDHFCMEHFDINRFSFLMHVFLQGEKICKQNRLFLFIYLFYFLLSRINLVQTRLLHRFPAGSSQMDTFRTLVSMETGKWFPQKAQDSALKHPVGYCHYVSGELRVRDLFSSPPFLGLTLSRHPATT